MPDRHVANSGDREAAALELVLCVAGGPRPAGEVVPVEVELRNVGSTAVWVVGVLDGSEEGLRFPHYRPMILREGLTVYQPPQTEEPVGMVSPIRLSDFHRLHPGEGFDPTRRERGANYLPLAAFSTFRPARPGRYRLGLALSTESDRPEQWFGGFGQQQGALDRILDLIGRIPRGTVVARPVDIEVT